MNNFALTVEPRRYDAAVKTGYLELVGLGERRLWQFANMRGSIDWIVLYAVDRPKFTADFLSSTDTKERIVVRFSK